MTYSKICLGLLLAFTASHLFERSATAGEGCELVGRISVSLVKKGALRVCRKGHPVACAVTLAMEKYDKDIEDKTVDVCKISVKKVGEFFEFVIKSAKSKVKEMRKTHRDLKRVRGIRWKKKNFR